jgi:hypothetical protein
MRNMTPEDQKLYDNLRRKEQVLKQKAFEARRKHGAAKEQYVTERTRFLRFFCKLHPKHAEQIRKTVMERSLPDPQEAFAVIAGVFAVRRGPTEL